jgi:sodium-dependent dicarboxylate transporter 2/3/5
MKNILNPNNAFLQIMAAGLAASYAFMLPMGTAPNAIVLDASTMTILDMITAGFGMNIITLLTTAAAIETYAVPIFGLDTFPEWAVSSLPVNQTCVPA